MQPSTPVTRPRVLLVEDSIDFSSLMAVLLAKDGIDVVETATGEEALVLASQESFDLVLVDLGLPDMSGFEVCGELKKRDELRDIPVIILTGRNTIPDKVKSFELGAADYIEKSFDNAEIRARIVAALRTKHRQALWAAAAHRQHERTEQELLRVSKAVDAASDAVSILDLEGRQIYQNEAFGTLIGYAPNDLASSDAQRRLFVNPQTWDVIWSLCKSGSSWRGETEVESRSGRMVRTFCRADAVRDTRKEMIGVVCVFTDLNDRSRLGQDPITVDIENALKENRFELWLQPIIPLSGDHRRFFEVLLRLRDGKLMFPKDFIPAAERFGIMTSIDRHVVEKSIHLLESIADIDLSINISAKSLDDAGFATFISNILSEHKVNAARLAFEITESAMIMNLNRAREFILKVREMGCKFALDDFGSGFTCFTHLRDLPVNFVKIDGSFVKDMDRDPVNRALVKSMNEVAHALGKQTIAEYVVSQTVLEAVRELNIDYAQGWHLGEPALPSTLFGEGYPGCRK